MSRLFAVTGGLLFVVSLLFAAFAFATWFGEARPWSFDLAWRATLVDVALFTIFALHHSLFARSGLKSLVERVWPPALERSLYVWVASALFLLTCGLWQAVPGVLWRTSGTARTLMIAGQLIAAAFTLVAAGRLDVLDLAGLRTAADPARAALRHVDDTGPYGLVRHPIYLGWLGMVWLSPTMTGTRLVFAATSCLYLLIAIPFEERDLRRTFGDAYARYATRVKWRLVPFVH